MLERLHWWGDQGHRRRLPGRRTWQDFITPCGRLTDGNRSPRIRRGPPITSSWEPWRMPMPSRTRSCCAATRPAAARLTPRPRPGSPGTRSPHPLAGGW